MSLVCKRVILGVAWLAWASQARAGIGVRTLGGWGQGLTGFHSDLAGESGAQGQAFAGSPGTGVAWGGEIFYDFLGNIPAPGQASTAPLTKIKPLRVIPTNPSAPVRSVPFIEVTTGAYGMGLRLGGSSWDGSASSFSLSAVPVVASLNLVCPLGQKTRLISGLGAGYVPASTAQVMSQRYSGPDASNPYPYTQMEGSVQYGGALAMRACLAAEYDLPAGFSLVLGTGLLVASLEPQSATFTQTSKATDASAAVVSQVNVTYVDKPSQPGEQWKESMAIHFCQASGLAGITWRY